MFFYFSFCLVILLCSRAAESLIDFAFELLSSFHHFSSMMLDPKALTYIIWPYFLAFYSTHYFPFRINHFTYPSFAKIQPHLLTWLLILQLEDEKWNKEKKRNSWITNCFIFPWFYIWFSTFHSFIYLFHTKIIVQWFCMSLNMVTSISLTASYYKKHTNFVLSLTCHMNLSHWKYVDVQMEKWIFVNGFG